LPEQREVLLEADHTTPWIARLLTELTNSITGGGDEKLIEQDSLNLSLRIEKDYSVKWHEYVTVDGQMSGIFHPPCIRCLERSMAPISLDICACLISEEHESHPELQEHSDILLKNTTREAFFYAGRQLDIYPFLWELLVFATDPNPLHHPECLGLCPSCGINLNNEQCSHKKSLA
jgi:uncharacterized metal-binding protein YceD (DUF177 family)